MLAGHSNISTTGIYLHANPKIAIEKARDVF
jgi:site-specific recombinase XerD